MNFTVIVIDTASTGHTLRLLTLSLSIEKALEKVLELKNRMEPYLYRISMIFGPGFDIEAITEKIEDFLGNIKAFNQHLKNNVSYYITFLKHSKLINFVLLLLGFN